MTFTRTGPLRILEVCPYPLDQPGGVQHQVLALGAGFRAFGHQVDTLSPSAGLGVRIQVNGATSYLAESLSVPRSVIQRAVEKGYDVVHVHEPLHPFCLRVASSLRDGRPALATAHAAVPRRYSQAGKVPWRHVSRRYWRIVASSHTAAASAVGYVGSGVVVVPLGSTAAVVRTGLLGRDDSVLFLGRHDKRKGLRCLLAAARLQPSLIVNVAGEGPETLGLRKRYGLQNVIWLGRVDENEKSRLLQSAGVLAAPAERGESFGIVLLEAMASGLPIVASDIPGYREALGQPAAGVLVAPCNPFKLAASLTSVLGSEVLRRSLIERGCRRVEGLDMDASVIRYLELFRGIPAEHERVKEASA